MTGGPTTLVVEGDTLNDSKTMNLYKRYLSPLLHYALSPVTGGLSACRFTPTCSQYFSASVAKYGIIHGSLKGLWRILRCNPFSAGGFDPV